MRAIAELKHEHDAIRDMIEVLLVATSRLAAGIPVPGDDLEAIADFLSVFADQCHHRKEEKYLFPALERAGIRSERGPLGVMLAEHDEGRERLAALKHLIVRCRDGQRDAPAALATYAQHYAELLTAHIAKENTALYPLAEAFLEPGDDAELVAAFARLDSATIGLGRHAAYHALLERLRERYPPLLLAAAVSDMV